MYLLDKNGNELLKFYVNLGRLFFLGKELRNVTIYTYPIIIFEFMTGYYTTEELFKKNNKFSLEFVKDYEIMEFNKELQKTLRPTLTLNHKSFERVSTISSNEPRENRLLSSNTNLPTIKESEEISIKTNHLSPDKKIMGPMMSDETKAKEVVHKNQPDIKSSIKSASTFIGAPTLYENPGPKKEGKEKLSKSVLIKKKVGIQDKKNNDEPKTKSLVIPYYNFIINYQKLDYFINPQETNKESNINVGKELEAFREGLEQYKRKLRILQMQEEIDFLTKKNEAIKELNKDLKEIIKHKKDNLEKVKKNFEPSQKKYQDQLVLLNNNLKGRGRYQLIYDSFVYQKMVEVCFAFFNSKIQSLYNIPKFYSEPIINDTKKLERLEYYNNDKRNISSMMGHICQLLVHISKTFNIPMRFPIYLNGSRSYILRSLKDKMFLPLYLDGKKEDKHGIFEIALNCLKDDIKEIFNFFSMFPEIISKSDNKRINDMNGKHLFFFFFVVFNHSLFRFMKIFQNMSSV